MTKIPRKQFGIEEMNVVVKRMIESNNDREVGIFAGAFIEGLLYDLLKRTVVNSHLQSADAVFRVGAPLSTVGDMISLSFAFGLISENEYNHLRVIQDVRNYCAHSLNISDEDMLTFEHPEIKKRLKKIVPDCELVKLPKEMREQFTDSRDRLFNYDGGRLAFRYIFCLASMSLFSRILTATQLYPPPDLNEGVDA